MYYVEKKDIDNAFKKLKLKIPRHLKTGDDYESYICNWQKTFKIENIINFIIILIVLWNQIDLKFKHIYLFKRKPDFKIIQKIEIYRILH